ncbi:XrtA system polysaccharide deacetylase [Pleionea sediminis]|uniref:XrtA system polysaccharide deacetylase n=1 Tax=Pleionea sediminis TaxID=2569479 RepID=UPI001185DBB3|nr:XrtA system polysaccharide deacetylase [Pleionea sediminis]
MQNILSIDVEDYFQVAALAETIHTDEWEKIPTRVENNTLRLLDIFDEYNVKVTHFILGWVAERYPELIKEIHRRGHEVASHGYSHQLIYEQSPEVFKDETFRSKAILEDLCGEEVLGYRAASYSITKKSLWALDILAEVGFTYDSSIFPIVHDRYGIPNAPTQPHLVKTPNGSTILEYPLSTIKAFGQTIPIAGGGYFRLYPYWLSRMIYRRQRRKNESFVFYLHPWEIDPEQPKVEVSWFSKFRHYNNLQHCETRLRKLLNEFKFGTMKEKLESLELINNSNLTPVSY